MIVVDKNIPDILCDFRIKDVISDNIPVIGLSKEIAKNVVIRTFENSGYLHSKDTM